MASLDDPLDPPDGPPTRQTPPPWREFIRAPLAPIALAGTAGLSADRFSVVDVTVWLILVAVGLVGWVIVRKKSRFGSVVLIFLTWFGLAAAWHHVYRNVFDADDLGRDAGEIPTLVRVRGLVSDEPILYRADRSDPLVPSRKPDFGMTVLSVREIRTDAGNWRSASGNARLVVDREIEPDARYALDGIHVGDEVEVTAMLSAPSRPANPGERDQFMAERDRRITSELRVSKSSNAVVRLERRSDWNLEASVAAARGSAARTLDELMPPRDAAVARALLLGDGSAMDRHEWDEYIRTGVVHVLAISGQHLVILAGFFWLLFRLAGVRTRYAALVILVIVFAYAVLTGLRPSASRAVIMVFAMSGGLIFRRLVNPANSFALAWIFVAARDPTDPFTLGCQLSFLAVFVLVWGVFRWVPRRHESPLDRLIDESRPAWVRALRMIGKGVGVLYLVTIVLFAATGPILLDRQNVLSPVGLLIGPPLVLLTGVALITGFLTLLIGSASLTLATPFAALTQLPLALCGVIVRAAERIPGGVIYGPAPPLWWLAGFCLAVIAAILLGGRWSRRIFFALTGWVILGAAVTGHSYDRDELRVTFLSIGHGTCVVLEADGRVLLYDIGTMAGPDVIRRTVAPYLWSRGIRRIDEVFLSHADIDHFNGLPELLRRFPVGVVTLTPSFADKPTPEVGAVLDALKIRGIERRVAVAGDCFESGRVAIEVLHPPPVGPGTTENEKSLVLFISFAGRSVLLTGDLELSGAAMVIQRPPVWADVVMAPHHGSRTAFGRDVRDWLKPRFIVVSKGRRDTSATSAADAPNGAVLWDTVSSGAITVRIHSQGVVAEAFRTGERVVVGK